MASSTFSPRTEEKYPQISFLIRENKGEDKVYLKKKHCEDCETALRAKKAFIERKALLKDMIYRKKGFIVEKVQTVLDRLHCLHCLIICIVRIIIIH